MIHCTLGKKGVLPSAWEHVDGRGVRTTFLASSPVESADPVLGSLYFNAAVPFSRSIGDFWNVIGILTGRYCMHW